MHIRDLGCVVKNDKQKALAKKQSKKQNANV